MHNRLLIFRQLLSAMTPGKLLDLGAGHGRFSLVAHTMGWKVTAVDARTDRMPGTRGIRWVHSDVRDYEIGRFDVVAILGLLYHLERADQERLFERCAGMTTIIDTHVARRPLVDDGGYRGSYFSENLSAPTASWSNDTSFWPTEDSLFRMLERTHPTLLKVLPEHAVGRTFYVATAHGPDEVAPWVESFAALDRFQLEVQRPGARDLPSRLADLERRYEAVARERDQLDEDLQRLRRRKSVRGALALAGLAAPLVRRARARQGSPGGE